MSAVNGVEWPDDLDQTGQNFGAETRKLSTKEKARTAGGGDPGLSRPLIHFPMGAKIGKQNQEIQAQAARERY